MRILSIDVGSTSVKAGYWNGKSFRPPVRVPYRARIEGHRAEVSASVLIPTILKAGAEALREGDRVDAVAYCIFSSGVIVTDAANKPRTPIITHADRRSEATAQRLVRERPGGWWLDHSGNLPYPGGIGSTTLAWLREHESSVFRGRYHVGQVSTYVSTLLTGTRVIDPSQAVFLGVFDIRENDWNPEACRIVGIDPESLPRVAWADSVLGGLTLAIARRWGIAAGVPVVGGFVDTSAATIQTPMTLGQLAHNAGSTDVLALSVDRPHPMEGILTRPVGVSGRWIHEKKEGLPPWVAVRTMASSGSAIEWIGRTLFPSLDIDGLRRLVKATCRRMARPGHVPTAVRCVPTFVGERTTLSQPEGASFSRIRLGTTPEELIESAIRALADESGRNYTLLSKIHPPLRKVFVMGGASALADTMHAAWPRRHEFSPLKVDGLRGLVLLAQRVLARKS